ncbi:MAG: PSD1 domain-containing protein [Planctomycetales bacterium]|nr:PSD1 domain-containing protein [Planctomycetales bacterium]
MSPLVRIAVFALLLFFAIAIELRAQPATVDFGRDIRPVLSDKCWLCHGPADTTRQADLRLDVRQEAIDFGAFIPGNAPDSELVARIMSEDPQWMMPPPESGKRLTEAEKGKLNDWIAQGAEYAEHWAFRSPERPPVPGDGLDSWCRNPIDYFILRQNQLRGVDQAPAADRRTLIRRIYLDLIGLPPTPEQIAEQLSSKAPDALDRLVDDLLKSPHFGERWARWWLDAARYADSDGYEKDKPRSVWFYRDWVINAMNQNMPYDQFLIEQIAGDLLPNAGQSQHVATGFLRNSMVNEEGGADPEQFRIEGMFDRMDAIGKAMLGITTQCAQCHSHKYDPLSQQEYYQMFAALNDFHEAAIAVFTPAQEDQRDAVLARIRNAEDRIKENCPDWKSQVREWAALTRDSLPTWTTVTPTDLPFEGQKFRVLADGSILSESYAPTKTANSFRATIHGMNITGIRLDALQHPQLPLGGPGRSIFGTGAVSEFEASIAMVSAPESVKKIKFVRAMADVNPATSKLPSIFRDQYPAQDDRVTGSIEYAIDGNKKTAWSTDNGAGRRNQDRLAVFVPEEPIQATEDMIVTFTLNQSHGGWNSDDNQNYLLGRYRFSITGDEIPAAVVPAEIEKILRQAGESLSEETLDLLFQHWRTTQAQFASLNEEIERAWDDFPEPASQLVVEAMAEPRQTHVLVRGDFLRPAERVQPAAPKFLGQLPDSHEPARLRLARWLPQSPTTARAIVNRLWQSYFGQALVPSPEDLGVQSQPPSHPELLDWLACELISSGWDLKHIHRLIASSATYRQSSEMTAEIAESDPNNAWYARGPRFRVDGETVRDLALAVGGLLNLEVGGLSVYPPAPGFLFEPPTSYGPKSWPSSSGQGQYRRSLYVHSFRSVPYPVLQIFDSPKGDAACVRRERTNTPLQALVLLNETQFVECARSLAARILREADTEETRIEYAWELVLGRKPKEHEAKIIRDLLQQQRERIARGEIDASQLIGLTTPLVRQLTGQPPEELGAWMIAARTLLNLDETITKQ